MDQSADEDQDSLFGSPPPSPARGRSPSQETSIGERTGPVTAVPSAGGGRKNVGTIALPGSHMSCAELPANLPASSLSLSRPISSQDSRSSLAGTPTTVHTLVGQSRSSSRVASSRSSSSAASIVPSTPAFTRKRRTPKAKSVTPAPPPPPIALPGPNEPTPPNFLRSQSSLLGLAGLVGSVKPAQLYAHGPQPTPARRCLPIRGSAPAYPIVLDDDQEASEIGKLSSSQHQIPQRLDQLDPEVLCSNIMNSLVKEKNIFPVLESLIKLLGDEPHFPSESILQKFVRPYGHSIFNTQSSPAASPSAACGSTTPTIQPPKRRKLKHVPAGAVDWDIPFPFAVGEGPERYHESWAQHRAKQLLIQLLELVQGAAKKAAIKTAKGREQTRVRDRRSSRSVPAEAQTSSTRTSIPETSSHTSPRPEGTVMGVQSDVISMDRLYLSPDLSESSSTVNLSALGPGGALEEDSLAFHDHSAFEEWLSQLQQFTPSETNTHTPELDCGTHLPPPLESSTGGLGSSMHPSVQPNTLTVPLAVRDEAIDPFLLAMAQLGGSGSHYPQSSTPPSSTFVPSYVPQVPDSFATPSMLVHSPRTSLSSPTEPLTPPSEAFADAPADRIAHQELDRDPPIDHSLQAFLMESRSEPPCTTLTRKGKQRADVSIVTSSAPSTSGRSAPCTVSSASKGGLDRHAILERARERRKQLVAEIERGKMEIWETSIKNAVLVHLLRNGPS